MHWSLGLDQTGGFKTCFGCSFVLCTETSNLNFVRFHLLILKNGYNATYLPSFTGSYERKKHFGSFKAPCKWNDFFYALAIVLSILSSQLFFFFIRLFWANLGSQQNPAEVQRNPIHPGPHIHSPPHCWHPHQSGTFLTVSLFWDTITSKVPQWFLPLPSKQYPGDSTASENAVQFSSVAQSCPPLCDPMDCSTPGLPVHHQLPEFTQTHVHWVSDAIQPSHPLLSPSSPAFNLSQHQGLFKWVSSSHQAAKVLEFQFQHQSFQWIFRTDFL